MDVYEKAFIAFQDGAKQRFPLPQSRNTPVLCHLNYLVMSVVYISLQVKKHLCPNDGFRLIVLRHKKYFAPSIWLSNTKTSYVVIQSYNVEYQQILGKKSLKTIILVN